MEHLLKKRWLFLFALGVMFCTLGIALASNYKYFDAIEEKIFMIVYTRFGSYNLAITTFVGIFIILIGIFDRLSRF